MSNTVLLLGHNLKPLDTVAHVGAALGLKRGTAFSRSAHWPVDGEKGNRRVIVPALADQLGIPYEIVTEDGDR